MARTKGKKTAPAVAAPVVTVVAAPAPAPVENFYAAKAAESKTTALTPAQVTATATAPAKAKKLTHAPRSSFTLQQTVATVCANPRRPNTDAHTNWEFYKVGQTLKQCMDANAATNPKGCAVLDVGYIAWDLAHGYITLTPLAPAPTATEKETAKA